MIRWLSEGTSEITLNKWKKRKVLHLSSAWSPNLASVFCWCKYAQLHAFSKVWILILLLDGFNFIGLFNLSLSDFCTCYFNFIMWLCQLVWFYCVISYPNCVCLPFLFQFLFIFSFKFYVVVMVGKLEWLYKVFYLLPRKQGFTRF